MEQISISPLPHISPTSAHGITPLHHNLPMIPMILNRKNKDEALVISVVEMVA